MFKARPDGPEDFRFRKRCLSFLIADKQLEVLK
jgi:hypothetical protein